MTVKDAIELLSQQPLDAVVYTIDGEIGPVPAKAVGFAWMRHTTHPGYGEYEVVTSKYNSSIGSAVVIS